MLRTLCISVLIFAGVAAQAQIQYLEQKPAHIEKTADSLTKIYSNKLGMTPKQDLLFKTNVADYLLMREQVAKEYTGKQKLDELYKASLEESGAMSEVLTEYQFELYEKIKPSIQPVDVVEKD
ncbi:hypothetical protein [Leeuwenhoekiella aestuarii]|uniref:Peptidylprolyl isomerase n=1 Tax=Leeuwenhoekiella aestuarii TaxID=2249426 RepID=A0A4Q0NVF9_9FLAO|nr:hypothetical protein [Leeuwenhoekiella aestuarii]RXG15256.1 hypothetical protein DSM04_103144 [Leeuwenhoekiella aestuarii]